MKKLAVERFEYGDDERYGIYWVWNNLWANSKPGGKNVLNKPTKRKE